LHRHKNSRHSIGGAPEKRDESVAIAEDVPPATPHVQQEMHAETVVAQTRMHRGALDRAHLDCALLLIGTSRGGTPGSTADGNSASSPARLAGTPARADQPFPELAASQPLYNGSQEHLGPAESTHTRDYVRKKPPANC